MDGTRFESTRPGQGSSTNDDLFGDLFSDFDIAALLREAAVTVTEAGLRGYKLIEEGVDTLAGMASEVYAEARVRTERPSDTGADAAGAAPTPAAGSTVGDTATGFTPEDRR